MGSRSEHDLRMVGLPSICVYIYIYVYMYTAYLYIYIHTYIRLHVYIYIYIILYYIILYYTIYIRTWLYMLIHRRVTGINQQSWDKAEQHIETQMVWERTYSNLGWRFLTVCNVHMFVRSINLAFARQYDPNIWLNVWHSTLFKLRKNDVSERDQKRPQCALCTVQWNFHAVYPSGNLTWTPEAMSKKTIASLIHWFPIKEKLTCGRMYHAYIYIYIYYYCYYLLLLFIIIIIIIITITIITIIIIL